MLIGIEGLDGCGKGTQVKLLVEALIVADPKATVKTYAFPNRATMSSALIDQFLKDDMRVFKFDPTDSTADSKWSTAENATAVALQCAMIVNRMEFVSQILACQREGHTVIFDRYTDSGIVYGSADGISSVWLAQAQLALPQLDLHVLLDIDVETSFARRPERQELYESRRERMQAVCDGYRAWWRLNQRTSPCWMVIDGRRSIGEVHQDLLQSIRNFQEHR